MDLTFIDITEYEMFMRNSIATWVTCTVFTVHGAFMNDAYWLLLLSVVCICRVVLNFCKFQSVIDIKNGKYSTRKEGGEIIVKSKTYVWRFRRKGSYEDNGVGVAFIIKGYYTKEVFDE